MTKTYKLPADPTIRRILLIKWSSLGDLAVASAIFDDVYRAFPNADIHLNTTPAYTSMFAADPRFKKLISIDIRRRGAQLAVIREWLRTVHAGRYDLVVDLQSNDRSRLLLLLLRLTGRSIRYRIGNNRQIPYNIYPSEHFAYTLDRYQSALRAAGIPVRARRPVIYVPEQHETQVLQLMQTYDLRPGTYAVFMPGCQPAGYLKRWGSENYIALGRLLLASTLEKIVVIGTQNETQECAAITEALGTAAVNLCERTKILDLLPLCRSARCVVGSDTGTAHLAAANVMPLLVVFGPTDPNRHKPAGDNVVAIQASADELDCLNCYQKQCSHHSCMKLVTPELAFHALMRIPYTPA